MELATHIALGLAMAASGLQVHWHESTAIGTQTAGRLEQGVRLPAEGRTFFTWDPVVRRTPNRAWRRWGTDHLVRVVLRVAQQDHAAHPRADGRELAPRHASEIDRRRSQELVDRFLAAGAQVIFVGPNTGLSGPSGRVQPLAHHDNHLHVRLEQE